jgi:hypothetical protein
MKRLRISDGNPGPRNSSYNAIIHYILPLLSLRLYRDDSKATGRRRKLIYFGIYLSKERDVEACFLCLRSEAEMVRRWRGGCDRKERIVWATSPLIDVTAETVQTQAKSYNM